MNRGGTVAAAAPVSLAHRRAGARTPSRQNSADVFAGYDVIASPDDPPIVWRRDLLGGLDGEHTARDGMEREIAPGRGGRGVQSPPPAVLTRRRWVTHSATR